MPTMSLLEASFCRSAPWRLLARRIVPWSTQNLPLAGDVLEIGGGSGRMAEQIVRVNSQVRITTTDIDPAMVMRASERLAEFPSAVARQADAKRLPFDDESFDAVAGFLMLHHIIEWEQAVAEVARVLRPGGQFVGYDLAASRAASLLHLVDRSPHRLIHPGAFAPALRQNKLELLSLKCAFRGGIFRFLARKAQLAHPRR